MKRLIPKTRMQKITLVLWVILEIIMVLHFFPDFPDPISRHDAQLLAEGLYPDRELVAPIMFLKGYGTRKIGYYLAAVSPDLCVYIPTDARFSILSRYPPDDFRFMPNPCLVDYVERHYDRFARTHRVSALMRFVSLKNRIFGIHSPNQTKVYQLIKKEKIN